MLNDVSLDLLIEKRKELIELWARDILSDVLSDCGEDAVDRVLDWVWSQSVGRHDKEVMFAGLWYGVMYNIRDPASFTSLLDTLQYLENLRRTVKRLESDQNLLRELRAYACGEREPG